MNVSAERVAGRVRAALARVKLKRGRVKASEREAIVIQ